MHFFKEYVQWPVAYKNSSNLSALGNVKSLPNHTEYFLFCDTRGGTGASFILGKNFTAEPHLQLRQFIATWNKKKKNKTKQHGQQEYGDITDLSITDRNVQWS